MARFRGTVRGGRGTGSRLGHATTGLHAEARSWNGSVEVQLFVNTDNDEDYCNVRLNTGDGKSYPLYWGPLQKYKSQRKVEMIQLWDRHNPTE